MVISTKSVEKSSEFYMSLAIEEALKASSVDFVPVGAVVVSTIGQKSVVASAVNEMKANMDPTAHAEISAIRKACASLEALMLPQCDIYVTLEPCPMCAHAISLARIRRLYFGAYSEKSGGVINGCRVLDHSIHKTEVISGVLETQCSEILKNFFKGKRY